MTVLFFIPFFSLHLLRCGRMPVVAPIDTVDLPWSGLYDEAGIAGRLFVRAIVDSHETDAATDRTAKRRRGL